MVLYIHTVMLNAQFMICFRGMQLLVSRLKEAYTNAKTSRNNELKNTLIITTGEIGRYSKTLHLFNILMVTSFVCCHLKM